MKESIKYSHSCLINAILIGCSGCRAARLIFSTSAQTCRDILVSGVVIKQNAARVFITGLGLPALIANP